MRPDVAGVVLVGGRSRRMGRDKALLEIDGRALATRAAATLAAICPDVALVAGRGRRYPELPVPQLEDARADSGPLAGIETALEWAAPRSVLVLACDLPRVDGAILERLVEGSSAALEDDRPRAWIASRGGRLQPLCGLYNAGCGEVFGRLLDGGDRSVLKAAAAVDALSVPFDDLDPDPFLNVNTPSEYARAGGRIATGR